MTLHLTKKMSSDKYPIIDTEYGPVQGVLKTTALGRNIFDFRAIPYMKAPIGKLRFRDAQPPDQWSEPFNTNIERPTYFCPPFPPFPADGQEDAGIVSVSTPYLDRKLPVLVYIHGGGFQIASGKLNLFGGDYLLQKDIVYVAINYRVGPIGFLSLKDPELDIPGNAGLKDQVFALKWIQKNIAKFGGDPENVTIFGTSAGGASVHMLMMTDLTRGLFKKAIPMSGTAFIKAWPFAARNNLTERLATSLGWDGQGGERGILEVLENADAKDLVVAESKLLTLDEKFIDHTPFPFTPVVEPYVNEKTFLAKDPVLMGRETWSNSIDCMMGGTSLEGGIMMMWLREVKLEEMFEDPAGFVLTRELGLDITIAKDKEKASEYGTKLKNFYFGAKEPSMDTLNEYLSYAGDLHFWHGIYRAVLSRLHSNGTGRTFFYQFDLNTKINFMKLFTQSNYKGACHGDDMSYLFKANLPGIPEVSIGSKEFELINKMVSLVTSFAITGNPISVENDVNWEPSNASERLKCFNISNDSMEMIDFPGADRLRVWDEICEDSNVPLY